MHSTRRRRSSFVPQNVVASEACGATLPCCPVSINSARTRQHDLNVTPWRVTLSSNPVRGRRLKKARPCCAFVLLTLTALTFYGNRLNAQATVQGYSGTVLAPQPPSLEVYQLTGTVIDAVTGEPIRKALIQVYSNIRRVTFSDEYGRFVFEGMPTGSYSVVAQKPGYFSNQELQRGGVSSFAEAGPKVKPAVVKLTPEAVLTGKITTADGVPLEHVPLSLNYIEIREGRRRWELKGSAVSDEDGRYRFANLRPGSYYVGASPYTPLPQTLLDADESPKTGYPGAYYPGGPDLASTSPIQLSAGEHAEANITLSEVPVYAVSGTVSGYAANQGVGLQVFDPSGAAIDRGIQFSAENGRFDVLALPAGNYVIKAFSSGGPNQQLRAELPFHLAGDLHNLHLTLAPSPTIAVKVQMEANSQRSGRRSQAQRMSFSGPPVSVRLAPMELGREGYASFDSPNNQQSLSIREVDPGRYTAIIDTHTGGGWYVASAEYGRTNLLNDELVLTAGAPTLPINIVLRNDSASLTGTVNIPADFKTQATIVAVPERASKISPGVTYWYPPQDKNAALPEFLLDSLAPGEYLVYAFDRADGLEYTNREVLQDYTSKATHVTLAPDQRAKITLELIRIQESSR